MFRKRLSGIVEFLGSTEGIMLLMSLTVIAVILWVVGADPGHLAAAVIPGVAGGSHVIDEPLTLDLTRQASPSLLRNEIDERIVRIRPMATPLDQISRCGGSRLCGSMVVDYYSVDTKPVSARCRNCSADSRGPNGFAPAIISTDNDMLFEPSETIMVPSVSATADGVTGSLVLYVTGRDSDGVSVIAVNNRDADGEYVVPDIPAGAEMVRMGRAAGELDVQTAQFESLPVKSRNYCQIFKAQVEQSTFQKIANKEVGWTFSDQEESAIIDMRQGMEKNFLFGCMNRVYDPSKRTEIMLTGGIWNQAGNEFVYDPAAMDLDTLVTMSRKAFTGNAGSSKKILVGGSLLIEALNKLDHVKTVGASETMTRWGLDFTEIVTKFGRLYVVMSEVFDQCGRAADGMIIDPEYITKYSHVPFRAERLDLRASGVRNTDAIVITEASCLVLRYPAAHMRIVARNAAES